MGSTANARVVGRDSSRPQASSGRLEGIGRFDLCAAPGLVVENSIALGLADVLFGNLSRSDSPAVPSSSRLRVEPLAAESSRTEDGQHPERT
jgi:hypothetical protein